MLFRKKGFTDNDCRLIFVSSPQCAYMIFIYLQSSIIVIHPLDGLFGPNIMTSSQLACQLSWQSAGIAEVMCSQSRTYLNFFQVLFQLLVQQCSQLRGSLIFVSSPECTLYDFHISKFIILAIKLKFMVKPHSMQNI